MRHLIIKLGGSVITDKTVTKKLRPEVLEPLIETLNNYALKADEKVWLFHGGGSYAHFAAQKWFSSGLEADFKAAARGMDELNQLVTAKLKHPFKTVPARLFWEQPTLQWASSRHHNELFVGHGDAVETNGDKKIVSTEEQLLSLVQFLKDEPKRLLFLGQTPGVLDNQGHLIETLHSDQLPDFYRPEGADVTGGMAAKISQAFQMLTPHTEICLSSGLEADNLKLWLNGSLPNGTHLKN